MKPNRQAVHDAYKHSVQPPEIIHNTTPYTLDDTFNMPTYGRFMNSWRQRFVVVHVHPSDPERVITVGRNFATNTTWICDEPRADYASRIDRNDWSEYK